ncbi:MAG TPA: DUF4175 family protein [Rhodothermales bacterium]|nr:DUF4175 family protein [Rhodothermales bacterium]
MSEQTLNLVQLIRERLQATVSRVLKAEMAYGLALTLGILAALWLISTVVEAGFWLETASRSLLSWILLAVVIGLGVYFLVLPLLRLLGVLPGPSEEAVAARIGERYPDVSDRLTDLLHLAQGKRSESPDAFVDRAVRMLGEQIHPVPFEQMEDFGRARRFGRYAGVPLAGLGLFLLLAPTAFIGASHRLLSPGVYFQRPAPFQLTVEPGSRELVKGAALDIAVRATGQVPHIITLNLNNQDEKHVDQIQLTPDSTGVFRHTVVNVREPMRYRITADPVETPWYDVGVVERPLLRGLNVSLDFPRYTRIPAQRLQANVGDVEALAGTRVSIEAAVGSPNVKEAYLQFDDGSRDTLAIDGETAQGSFTLRKDGQYRIILRNEQGVENENPVSYSLKALPDAAPGIALLAPDSVGVLTEALVTPLRARITDDYGFSRLRLYYRLAESRYGTPADTFAAIGISLQNPAQIDQDVAYDWLLSETTKLDPVPGDVIEYYLQVWDNDTFTGPKSARTGMHRLRLPSLSEQYQQLDQQQDQAQDALSGIMEDAEEIRDQFQELQNDLRSKRESDWQDQRQLQQLQNQQKNLEERVESLSKQVESLTDQMQENNLVSDETLQKYRELQRVIDEINSPELQDALRQLQQAMQQLDLQQMQQSLGKFQFNEQQYQERLERTLELFKKLRMQQQLDEAAKRARALAELQKELAQQTGKLMKEQQQTDTPRPNEPAARDSSEAGRQQDERSQSPDQQDPSDEAGQQQDSTQSGRRDPTSQDEQTQDQQNQNQQNQKGQSQDQQNQDQQNQGQQSQDRQEQGKQGDQQQSKEQLAAEQERSRDEMRALEQKLQEMQQQMDALRSAPKQQMEQLGEQARQQQLSNEMQQNAQQLQQSQLQKAQQGQQQMNQQLQQLSRQLQQMQQNMQGQQKQVNMAGLRRALEDVLTLSKRQEDLHEGVRGLSSDNAQLREYARQQEGLSESLRAVSDSLQKLSHDIPQMDTEIPKRTGEALNAMHAAVEAMTERSATEAVGQQQASMMHLNELALLLSNLMDQLNNSQNGGSGGMSMQQMLQQLQQMAGQQQQLNDQVQQMLNDMHGNRLSPDMQQRLQQMARQQSAIRQQLQQLNRDPSARGKLLGDLNRVAEQMEETIRDLQQRQVDRPLVERQQQILTRLLDAQKSLQQRGKEKQRQSRTGQDVDRPSPPDLPPAEQIDRLRRDLLRALDSGYAPDYEALIKRYFELLQEQQGEAAEE